MPLSEQDNNKFARVVTFKNIANEEFVHTHCFGDAPPSTYRFQPGEQRVLPFVIADFLAKHLARMILIGSKSSADPKDRRKLFGREDEDRIKSQILSDASSQVAAPLPTTSQIVAEQIARLNPEDRDEVDPDIETGDVRTKAELIEALKEKGERVDVRLSKSELKEQLSKILSA